MICREELGVANVPGAEALGHHAGWQHLWVLRGSQL